MSKEIFESQNDSNWVHVDAYTKDDGTHVREYWRRKTASSENINNNGNILNAGIQCDDSLYPPTIKEYPNFIKNNLKEVTDDFLVNNTNKTIADWSGNIISPLLHLSESHNFYKMASPNYNYNQEYANKNGTLYNSIDDLHDEKLEKKIKARLLLENTGMKDCKIFVGNEDSSLSQKIADSPEINDILQQDIEHIRELKCFPSIHQKITFNTPDLYNSIRGGNISEAKIDDEGNLHLVIEDLYNFNEGRTSVRGRVGEKLQKEGSLIPYYIKMNVKIPKTQLDRY